VSKSLSSVILSVLTGPPAMTHAFSVLKPLEACPWCLGPWCLGPWACDKFLYGFKGAPAVRHA
jgi:hypothetical protein